MGARMRACMRLAHACTQSPWSPTAARACLPRARRSNAHLEPSPPSSSPAPSGNQPDAGRPALSGDGITQDEYLAKLWQTIKNDAKKNLSSDEVRGDEDFRARQGQAGRQAGGTFKGKSN